MSNLALLNGIGAAVGIRGEDRADVAEILRRRYGAAEALLTDCGTSALILALQKIVPTGGTVAYPAYACIDLTSAALGAGVRVRLYDLNPETLSPDLDSLRAAIKRGVDAIVVAHLYGYPADVRAVKDLAAEEGVPVIEDAAQAAGGRLCGTLLGSLADVAILSFGRGKGTTGGSGGALLVRTPDLSEWTRKVSSHLEKGSRGGVELLSLVAQQALSHPFLYRLPASMPALKLGEMVYQPPRPPRAMAVASAAVLRWTLEREDRELEARRSRARDLLSRVGSWGRVVPVRPILGGDPGYLRLAVLDSSGRMTPSRDLGAVRGYPMTLDEHQELRPLLLAGERAGRGSQFLRDRLFTMPTHSRIDRAAIDGLAQWLEGRRPEAYVLAELGGAADERACS